MTSHQQMWERLNQNPHTDIDKTRKGSKSKITNDPLKRSKYNSKHQLLQIMTNRKTVSIQIADVILSNSVNFCIQVKCRVLFHSSSKRSYTFRSLIDTIQGNCYCYYHFIYSWPKKKIWFLNVILILSFKFFQTCWVLILVR